MAPDLPLAQQAVTVALNLALAVAVGAGACALWAARGASWWAAVQGNRARRVSLAALAIAMLADAGVLWLQAAAMAEVPVSQAGAAAWSMLTATHFGLAWSIGIGALVFSAAAMALSMQVPRSSWPVFLTLPGLAVFLYTRSMVSHAASDGDFGVALLADWLHLILACLWVGSVLVAGFLVLAAPPAGSVEDRKDCARYVASLSMSATFSLAGIFASGLFSAWRNLGSAGALVGSAYGAALLAKLALVGLAVLLGGINRFVVMPSLLAGLGSGSPVATLAARRFTMVLRIEAGVLLGVLMLAAILSSTSPPLPR
jgi:putative copper resistance protein D